MSYVVDGQTPVPNDALIPATRSTQQDGVPRACGGCDRLLEPNERFVIVLFHASRSTSRLCRYCILKLHRLAENPEV